MSLGGPTEVDNEYRKLEVSAQYGLASAPAASIGTLSLPRGVGITQSAMVCYRYPHHAFVSMHFAYCSNPVPPVRLTLQTKLDVLSKRCTMHEMCA